MPGTRRRPIPVFTGAATATTTTSSPSGSRIWGRRIGWHLLLRCGQCETYRDVVADDDTANAYERELGRGGAQIRRAVAELDGERMAAQVAAFIVALQRDLIDAGDFAAGR